MRTINPKRIGYLTFCALSLSACNISGDAYFERIVIDKDMAGDVKLIGDIDGDRLSDLIIGGKPSEKLNWYKYPEWSKTTIAVPINEFTTDGELGDVDGDGDLDIVVPDGGASDNLQWFENPSRESGGHTGDPLDPSAWAKHVVGSIGSWGKDVELADFDGNGLLDVAARSPAQAMIFFQKEPDAWVKLPFTGIDLGNEGMASGDIDGDQHVDLVLKGSWLRNPGDKDALASEKWITFPIGDMPSSFKALVADINNDGTANVLSSSSENVSDIVWWEAKGSDPTGEWSKHVIVEEVEKAHTLQAGDMDNDGDLDVVIGQMSTSEDKELAIYFNETGDATVWKKHSVDSGIGIHNGVIGDIDGDGDLDIFGANYTGNPPLYLWRNLSTKKKPTGWTYLSVDSKRGARFFGLASGDITGDGFKDVVSGNYFYHNPGNNMDGRWARVTFPENVDAMLLVDVDGDGRLDVVAQALPHVYWLRPEDKTGNNWSATKVASLAPTGHTNSQGYCLAQIVPGGKPETVFTTGEGLWYLRIPDDPRSVPWEKVQITAMETTEDALGVGDIDGDGDSDVVAAINGNEIHWWINPGDGTNNWENGLIGQTQDWADRVVVTDIDGDARLDVVVTDENGRSEGAGTFWFKQPTDPTAGGWQRHKAFDQASTNSMDAADINGDGDIDIITGEHKGKLRTTIWVNQGKGTSWDAHVVDDGKESHLGTRVFDLDEDGDLDIISIAWDEYEYLHVWRNDSK